MEVGSCTHGVWFWFCLFQESLFLKLILGILQVAQSAGNTDITRQRWLEMCCLEQRQVPPINQTMWVGGSVGTEPVLHSLLFCVTPPSSSIKEKNSWSEEFSLHTNLDLISGGSGWTPGQSGSGGTSFLYCHRTSLGEFNPPKGQGYLLILPDIFPFPKRFWRVLICNTPFNLLLGTEKCARMSIGALACLPAMASPAAARLSGSGLIVSTPPDRVVLVSGCFCHH